MAGPCRLRRWIFSVAILTALVLPSCQAPAPVEGEVLEVLEIEQDGTPLVRFRLTNNGDRTTDITCTVVVRGVEKSFTIKWTEVASGESREDNHRLSGVPDEKPDPVSVEDISVRNCHSAD